MEITKEQFDTLMNSIAELKDELRIQTKKLDNIQTALGGGKKSFHEIIKGQQRKERG